MCCPSLLRRPIGFTTSIGIGGDPVIGTPYIDAIEAFEKDPDTKIIVMICEIGGDAAEARRRREGGQDAVGVGCAGSGDSAELYNRASVSQTPPHLSELLI